MNWRGVLTAALALAIATPSWADPRPAGLRPSQDTPEGGLWDLMDKVEQQAKHSPDLNSDPALSTYVREVACKVAEDYCGELRVYVMDRPFMNATMAPNGYTEVYSGLLLRAADEAELAFVLGHEASHFAENHSLEKHEARKSRANSAMALTAVVAGVTLVAAAHTVTPQGVNDLYDAAGTLVDLIYFSAAASLFAFSREQESEADLLGLRRAAGAGYDAGQASAHLTLEARALGLHAHQFAGYDRPAVAQALGVPDHRELMAAIAIGVLGDPASASERDREREERPRTRRPLAESVHVERWGDPWPGSAT